MNLGDVVVSATRNATKRRLAPTLVNVLDAKIFDRTQSSFLSQALKYQPGVRVEDNCQNCGFSQVRINGLDGPYSQILVDSRPVYSALAGVYGLEQIPTNMIERIEVMRGGGSALFGSSAIAGVINVITKDPTSSSASFSHEIRGIGGLNTFENTTNLNATYVTENNKLGITIFGQLHHRSPYDYTGDGYSELMVATWVCVLSSVCLTILNLLLNCTTLVNSAVVVTTLMKNLTMHTWQSNFVTTTSQVV